MDDEIVYKKVVKKYEVDGLMNQISPKIFEMAACGTAMILFEGEYSGIVKPNVHFLPLAKDFSNVSEVITKLRDTDKLEEMVKNCAGGTLLTQGHIVMITL